MTVMKSAEFLLVSSNYQTLTAVAEGLQQVGASFYVAPTSEDGRDYVGRRKVEGIIVDLDVPGARELILFIRQSTMNRSAVVFACLPTGQDSLVAFVTGATFLLPHSLTPETVASRVSAVRDSMFRERRRFFRYSVSLPVYLTSDGTEQRAVMTSLSEGGMAVRTVKPVKYPATLDLAFELPSGERIAGKGSVAWANNEGMLGIQFQILRGQGQEVLQKWLQRCQLSLPA